MVGAVWCTWGAEISWLPPTRCNELFSPSCDNWKALQTLDITKCPLWGTVIPSWELPLYSPMFTNPCSFLRGLMPWAGWFFECPWILPLDSQPHYMNVHRACRSQLWTWPLILLNKNFLLHHVSPSSPAPPLHIMQTKELVAGCDITCLCSCFLIYKMEITLP